MAGIRTKADLLLALLFAGEAEPTVPQRSTPVVGITRLEKLLFLAKLEQGFLQSVPGEDDFHFTPFRMGPWSQEVYDEVDFLESLGLLSKSGQGKATPSDLEHDEELFSETVLDKYQKTSAVADELTELFELSPKGKEQGLRIWSRLQNDERQRLVSLKKRFNRMSLKQFLRYVYKKYPEYTTASEIREYLGLDE